MKELLVPLLVMWLSAGTAATLTYTTVANGADYSSAEGGRQQWFWGTLLAVTIGLAIIAVIFAISSMR
jgi:hypothetical protein